MKRETLFIPISIFIGKSLRGDTKLFMKAGIFGGLTAGLFWLVYNLTGDFWGTLGICIGVGVGVGVSVVLFNRLR